MPTEANASRRNWSKWPHSVALKKTIDAWDKYHGRDEEEDPLTITQYWKKMVNSKVGDEREETHVPWSTFYKYGRVDDKSKRLKQGIQVGPPVPKPGKDGVLFSLPPEEGPLEMMGDDREEEATKKRVAETMAQKTGEKRQKTEAEEKTQSMMEGYYSWLWLLKSDNWAGQDLDLEEKKERLQRQDLSREEEAYRRMRLDYNRACHCEEFGRKYWGEHLQRVCLAVDKTDAFYREELSLFNRCNNTFGSASVAYIGPCLIDESDEIEGSVHTGLRRGEVERALETFKLVEARKPLTLLHKNHGMPCLMVAADYILKKIEAVYKSRGLDPPPLRAMLRDEHYKKYKQHGKRRFPPVTDLDISKENEYKYLRQMRSIISKEYGDLESGKITLSDIRDAVCGYALCAIEEVETDTDLTEALLSKACDQINQCVGRTIDGVEADQALTKSALSDLRKQIVKCLLPVLEEEANTKEALTKLFLGANRVCEEVRKEVQKKRRDKTKAKAKAKNKEGEKKEEGTGSRVEVEGSC